MTCSWVITCDWVTYPLIAFNRRLGKAFSHAELLIVPFPSVRAASLEKLNAVLGDIDAKLTTSATRPTSQATWSMLTN
jgi:hypothetical protein